MTEENQSPEAWTEPPEEWIGQEVSLWHDEGGGPRGGGPTQTFGMLETVNEWGVVIDEEHSEAPEAYSPSTPSARSSRLRWANRIPGTLVTEGLGARAREFLSIAR
jgi:hypothetical protein